MEMIKKQRICFKMIIVDQFSRSETVERLTEKDFSSDAQRAHFLKLGAF